MQRNIFWIIGFCVVGTSVWASNKAGVVIVNSTGDIITRCVEFEEDVLTSEQLLQRSGFKIITKEYMGKTILEYLHDDGIVDGSANPLGWQWNLFLQNEGGWQLSTEGIASTTIHPKDVIGLQYGSPNQTNIPPRTFADVCDIASQAGLVIDHFDGERKVILVEFPGESITGLQLLMKSGLSVVSLVLSFGTAICSIDEEGQPSENCFGDTEGRYWAFNTLDDENQWISSMVGCADTIVRDQDVHGYQFCTWGTLQPPIQRQDVFELPSGVPFWGAYWK